MAGLSKFMARACRKVREMANNITPVNVKIGYLNLIILNYYIYYYLLSTLY